MATITKQPTAQITAKQYLKLHPEKYVLVTREFGYPLYIGVSTGLGALEFDIEDDASKAQQWSSLDNTDTKLNYYRAITGFKGLNFEQINISHV